MKTQNQMKPKKKKKKINSRSGIEFVEAETELVR
jgi:hypothetical protein